MATIGLSLGQTFRELTGKSDPPTTARFTELFHEYADRVMEASTIIYEDVCPILRRLRGARVQTGIVSTKLHYRLEGILRRNGLEAYIDIIVGADDVARPKPDPEGILLALRVLRVSRESAVYVGDHVVDAETARNAGVSFVATLSGACARSSFSPYPCHAIIGDLKNLLRVLDID
jgi:phosphoglycolate phosphatase